MAEAGTGWEYAGAELVCERGLAEEAVRQLKQHGAPAAVGSGAAAYGEAKAEYDGVIAGLSVALARDQAPDDRSGSRARLTRWVEKRKTSSGRWRG